MMQSRPCALIPVYNHGRTVSSVVNRVISSGLDVLLIDDGSNDETRNELIRIEKEFDKCTLFRLEKNQGKGGAVMHGLRKAESAGYTHALQIDADGQHDLGRIDEFLNASKRAPAALICGYPVYDDTVPSSRKSGRKITTLWVGIETLSRDIIDAMCGFRVYPLAATKKLLKKTNLGKRMDFDIEILVRLHWMNTSMVFLPIKVIYPEDGISHFRMFRDNVVISLAHTRLFLGMIVRLPVILGRKILKKERRNRR